MGHDRRRTGGGDTLGVALVSGAARYSAVERGDYVDVSWPAGLSCICIFAVFAGE